MKNTAYSETPTEGELMFTLKTKTEPNLLEEETNRLLKLMAVTSPESPEYAATADQLVKLYKLKEVDSKSKVSPDAMLSVAGSLLGIVTIVGYEHAHVVISKALGFVLKLK